MRLHPRILKFAMLLLGSFLLVVTSPLLPPIFHFSPTRVQAQTVEHLVVKPNQSDNFSNFADWCFHKDSLSQQQRHTVEVLLAEAQTSDCNQANEILSNLQPD